MNPSSDGTPTKKQRRAHSQAQRRRNPVLREQEQSASTVREAIAREEPGVREQEQPADTVRRAIARREPGLREQEQQADTVRRAIAREEPGVREQEIHPHSIPNGTREKLQWNASSRYTSIQ